MNVRRKVLTPILALFALSASAHARLGDSSNMLRERFGAPIRTLPSFTVTGATIQRAVYVDRGFVIVVSFWRGVSAQEEFFKISRTPTKDFVNAWFGANETFFDEGRAFVFERNLRRHSLGFSREEIKAVLDENSRGHEWRQPSARRLAFQRADNGAVARYVQTIGLDERGESLRIATRNFAQILDEQGEM